MRQHLRLAIGWGNGRCVSRQHSELRTGTQDTPLAPVAISGSPRILHSGVPEIVAGLPKIVAGVPEIVAGTPSSVTPAARIAYRCFSSQQVCRLLLHLRRTPSHPLPHRPLDRHFQHLNAAQLWCAPASGGEHRRREPPVLRLRITIIEIGRAETLPCKSLGPKKTTF